MPLLAKAGGPALAEKSVGLALILRMSALRMHAATSPEVEVGLICEFRPMRQIALRTRSGGQSLPRIGDFCEGAGSRN